MKSTTVFCAKMKDYQEVEKLFAIFSDILGLRFPLRIRSMMRVSFEP